MAKVMDATLLVVDDDAFTCSTLATYCKRYFQEVWSAHSSAVAWEMYEKHKPTVILSDIELEGESGLTFIQRIRAHDAQTLIYLLSGYPTQEYLLEAVRLHLEDFMQKPISALKLSQFIASCYAKTSSSSLLTLSSLANIFYCPKRKVLLHGTQEIYLTHMEIAFLELLLHHKGQIVSYETIEAELYPDKAFTKDSLRTLSSRLRKKTKECLIFNHPELGYRLITE